MNGSRSRQSALIIGASRGLGLAVAAEYLNRGWQVTATVRGPGRTGLHDLAESTPGELTVETVDITASEQVAALRARFSGATVDLLFVNAGTTLGDLPVTEVSTEEFNQVMTTNALSPVRLVEAFRDVVTPAGTIGVMSSRQGSITLNDATITNFGGGHDVYRASKSALNQLMRSYAARHRADPRTVLLINPGHVNTDLGGPAAPLTVDQSVPGVVDTIAKHTGQGGLHFLDHQDHPVPW